MISKLRHNETSIIIIDAGLITVAGIGCNRSKRTLMKSWKESFTQRTRIVGALKRVRSSSIVLHQQSHVLYMIIDLIW